jgi:hypothetical protein
MFEAAFARFSRQNGPSPGSVSPRAEQILPSPRIEGGTIRKNVTGNRLLRPGNLPDRGDSPDSFFWQPPLAIKVKDDRLG